MCNRLHNWTFQTINVYKLEQSTNIKKNDKSWLKTERKDKNNFFEFLTNLQKHHNILEQSIKFQ